MTEIVIDTSKKNKGLIKCSGCNTNHVEEEYPYVSETLCQECLDIMSEIMREGGV